MLWFAFLRSYSKEQSYCFCVVHYPAWCLPCKTFTGRIHFRTYYQGKDFCPRRLIRHPPFRWWHCDPLNFHFFVAASGKLRANFILIYLSIYLTFILGVYLVYLLFYPCFRCDSLFVSLIVIYFLISTSNPFWKGAL